MEGALMEPLAVGMHACELSNAKIGQSAVVLGCGCIGLVTIMSLRARGITEIYAADILDKRLEKAKKWALSAPLTAFTKILKSL